MRERERETYIHRSNIMSIREDRGGGGGGGGGDDNHSNHQIVVG